MQNKGDMTHIMITPQQLEWKPAPAGMPAGAKVAVLEGDPTKPGFFAMRILLPDGWKIGPHYHPNAERVTVISGDLQLGQGDTWDAAGLHDFTAGSYSSMPAGMHHFGAAKGETVIQISTIGPWGITYLSPGDDPRNVKP